MAAGFLDACLAAVERDAPASSASRPRSSRTAPRSPSPAGSRHAAPRPCRVRRRQLPGRHGRRVASPATRSSTRSASTRATGPSPPMSAASRPARRPNRSPASLSARTRRAGDRCGRGRDDRAISTRCPIPTCRTSSPSTPPPPAATAIRGRPRCSRRRAAAGGDRSTIARSAASTANRWPIAASRRPAPTPKSRISPRGSAPTWSTSTRSWTTDTSRSSCPAEPRRTAHQRLLRDEGEPHAPSR